VYDILTIDLAEQYKALLLIFLTKLENLQVILPGFQHFDCTLVVFSGWTPVNIGPKSLEKISSVISSCQVMTYHSMLFRFHATVN
jgi:hypothetical protein